MSIFGFFKQADINAGVQEFLKTEKAVLLDVRTKEEFIEVSFESSVISYGVKTNNRF